MPFLNSYDFQTAFITLLGELVENGQDVEVRGKKTKELLSCHISIANPLQLCYFVPFRKDNIFARIAETLWVLQGRNDIEWLSYYLPRAKDYSDDGNTWRAGYGKRLRRWQLDSGDPIFGGSILDEYDQLSVAIKKLQINPYTRQAVMSIWRPDEDNKSSLDIPCNNWLHFILRDFGITRFAFLLVAQRSADIFWGWSNINAFEWSILLQMMAFWTNSEVGKIDWLVTSMHMYEHHYETANKILETYPKTYSSSDINFVPPKFSTEFDLLTSKLQKLMQVETIFRNSVPDDVPTHEWTGDDLLDTFLHMLLIYIKLQQNSSTWLLSHLLGEMDESEYKYAAMLHVARQRKDLFTCIPESNKYIDLVKSVILSEN